MLNNVLLLELVRLIPLNVLLYATLLVRLSLLEFVRLIPLYPL